MTCALQRAHPVMAVGGILVLLWGLGALQVAEVLRCRLEQRRLKDTLAGKWLSVEVKGHIQVHKMAAMGAQSISLEVRREAQLPPTKVGQL